MGDSWSDPSSELIKLGDLLASPDLRKSFWLEPDETMEKQGIDASVIPQGLIDTLKTLSPLELSIVSRVSTTLREKLTEDELALILQLPV